MAATDTLTCYPIDGENFTARRNADGTVTLIDMSGYHMGEGASLDEAIADTQRLLAIEAEAD